MNRREWLAASFGAAVLPEILEAQQHAREAVKTAAKPVFFDQQTALEIEALTSEIIPTTNTPGAKEAGVIHFIDRAITTFDKERQSDYRDGMSAIQTKRAEMFPGSTSCAALTSAQRITLLKSIEKTAFFQLLRTHSIVGFLADPIYGGNPSGGYKTLNFQPAHMYKPPFGWYDDKANGGEN
jgi:gluconate 2-dehydrogenase gamma chain